MFKVLRCWSLGLLRFRFLLFLSLPLLKETLKYSGLPKDVLIGLGHTETSTV